MFDKIKLRNALTKDGYTQDEIDNVVEWMQDIRNWNVYTTKEVYKFLFKRENNFRSKYLTSKKEDSADFEIDFWKKGIKAEELLNYLEKIHD